jgi:hypothetical protein
VAVRVKLRITFSGRSIEGVAIANSGYETPEPKLLIPESLARIKWKNKLKSAIYVEYQSAGGPARFKILGKAQVYIKCEDKHSKSIKTNLLVSDMREIMMNDRLCGELGMVLLLFARGKWRFSDDPADTYRDSEPPQTW